MCFAREIFDFVKCEIFCFAECLKVSYTFAVRRIFHICRRHIFHTAKPYFTLAEGQYFIYYSTFQHPHHFTDSALYSPGAMPFSARKTRLKLEMLWKPDRMATSVRVISSSARSSVAFSMRIIFSHRL